MENTANMRANTELLQKQIASLQNENSFLKSENAFLRNYIVKKIKNNTSFQDTDGTIVNDDTSYSSADGINKFKDTSPSSSDGMVATNNATAIYKNDPIEVNDFNLLKLEFHLRLHYLPKGRSRVLLAIARELLHVHNHPKCSFIEIRHGAKLSEGGFAKQFIRVRRLGFFITVDGKRKYTLSESGKALIAQLFC